ncbi:hypothetical protein JCM10599A_15840 [Paraburkholderia kururiensis]
MNGWDGANSGTIAGIRAHGQAASVQARAGKTLTPDPRAPRPRRPAKALILPEPFRRAARAAPVNSNAPGTLL